MRDLPILFSGSMVRAILADQKTQTRRIVKNQPPDDVSSIIVSRFRPTVIDRRGDEVPGDEIFGAYSNDGEWDSKCPYGQPGDRLWVREAWQGPIFDDDDWEAYREDPARFKTPEYCHYAADGGPPPEFINMDDELVCRWRPAIHMPRWASRITLEITGMRIERLQDIGVDDSIAEGLKGVTKDGSLVKYGIPDVDGLPGSDDSGWPWREWRTAPVDAYCRLWDSLNAARGFGWDANPWVWVIEFERIA